jgi:WD40 repeat protein
VAVTGSWDGTVRVWDLATGAAVCDPHTGHTNAVLAVVTTVLEGRPVAVTGGEDATVRVWDLATGAPIGAPAATPVWWARWPPPCRLVCPALAGLHRRLAPLSGVHRVDTFSATEPVTLIDWYVQCGSCPGRRSRCLTLVVAGGTWGPDPAILDAVAKKLRQLPRPVPIRAPLVTDQPALAGARDHALEQLRNAIMDTSRSRAPRRRA